jgi:hypothetical protein
MSVEEYHRMDWEKRERVPGDTGYEHGRLLSGVRNSLTGIFNRFSRIRQVLDAETGRVPGEGSVVEVEFEEPQAKVAYRIDEVFSDRDVTYLQRDKYVLQGEAEEVVEGDYGIEEVPQEIEIGYASDMWFPKETEELEDPVSNTFYAYRNL